MHPGATPEPLAPVRACVHAARPALAPTRAGERRTARPDGGHSRRAKGPCTDTAVDGSAWRVVVNTRRGCCSCSRANNPCPRRTLSLSRFRPPGADPPLLCRGGVAERKERPAPPDEQGEAGRHEEGREVPTALDF